MTFYTIDDLRKTGIKPTWFGLGFIQFKLDDTQRLHFWHPDLPKEESYEAEWHDHRYGFRSDVLKGSITNILASCIRTDGGPNGVWEVCCSGGGAEYVYDAVVEEIGTFTTSEGHHYHISADTLHKVQAERCVTLQTRSSAPMKDRARIVAVKYDSPNPFNTELPLDHMWEIMSDLLGPEPGYHITHIEKGNLGEVSKIREELDELEDAVLQDARIMQLVELSDMMGAMQAFLDKYHAGYSLKDLNKMAQITKRAFVNGKRT